MLEASAESSWIEIDGSALRANLSAFRTVLGQGSIEGSARKFGVVLKANAYGHGLLETLSVVHPHVDIIHLISPRDALLIRRYEESRQLPRRRLLVIGATSPEEFVQLAEEEVEVTLGDDNAAKAFVALKARGLRAVAHVHVETGLSREGFFPSQMPQKLAFLATPDSPFEVRGVLSHFANTEDVTEQQYALQQLQQFEAGLVALGQLLGKDPAQFESHIAASAATLVLPASHCDFVRVGIGLYGLWPSSETRLSAKIVLPQLPKLKPVLSWRCRSQVVKTLAAGSYVGYGCTFRCERETKIAVLPVGYYDGYPRILSGRAYVLVQGHRAPVLGRIMMNHIVVDLTGVTGDEEQVVATLLGSDSGETVSAEMVAGWAQTIHYEIVTRIGSHLRRIVIDQ
jgi:alanine racemase